MALTYGTYLQIDELLSLQACRSPGPEHDEMLFITIHQVYELWFKQLLHEVDLLQTSMVGNDNSTIRPTLKRIRTILKTLVGQVDILETMTPISFKSFRGLLENSSGFQSAQFRELEFKLGKRRQRVLENYPPGSTDRLRLEKVLAEPSLYQSFLRYLQLNGFAVPEDAVTQIVSSSTEPNPTVQEVLIGLYRSDSVFAQICELMVDIDEGLQEWRYRHVKMVERTIGDQIGTGGSPGAQYLIQTLFTPLFPDLWEIRSKF